MKYEIKSKSDFSSGATLFVQIPEEEVDRKALYTIQEETPDFILPFHYKFINGYIELTYTIGARNKLQYSFKICNPQEYVTMWANILNPLLNCDDWFMNPFSFVLETDYMYYDKNNGTVSYVYIPSKTENSDNEQLKNLAIELAQKYPSNSPELEIKALRAIMHDFNPKLFLQMLMTYKSADIPSDAVASVQHTSVKNVIEPAVYDQVSKSPDVHTASGQAQQSESVDGFDDIVLDWSSGKKDKKKAGEKEKSKTGGLFGTKPGKQEKKQKREQSADQKKAKSSGILGKKKPEQQPIFMGAGAESAVGNERKKLAERSIIIEHEVETGTQLNDDGLTQLDSSAARLRLVSAASLPREIIVSCELGRAFIIGRFDVSVGRQQSDFEFDKSTKSVSRRHAAIEKSANGYTIVDLSSSAGTYVNGQKLPPNIPYELSFGTRISFGTSGADYVWEE